MKSLTQSMLLIFVSLAQLFVISVHSREVFLSSDAGIELTIEAAPGSTKTEPRVLCVLQNMGGSDLEYECSLDTFGLDFHLFGSQQQEMAMDEKWFRFHSPRNLDVVSTRKCRLSRGKKLSFTLNLKEVFPSGWQNGVKLKVDWLSTGTPFAPPAVSGVCELASLWAGSSMLSEDNGSVSSDQSASSSDMNKSSKATELKKNDEASPASKSHLEPPALGNASSSTTLWLVVLIAAFGLLWLWLKRRS